MPKRDGGQGNDAASAPGSGDIGRARPQCRGQFKRGLTPLMGASRFYGETRRLLRTTLPTDGAEVAQRRESLRRLGNIERRPADAYRDWPSCAAARATAPWRPTPPRLDSCGSDF